MFKQRHRAAVAALGLAVGLIPTIGSGPVFLRAAAQGQRLLAIANLVDKPLVELVLRKDVAAAEGITDKTPLGERARALRGKTIGIQGVGSIVHAWERLVA